MLTTEESSTEDNYHILHEAVKATVRSLNYGKSAGSDNFPVELLKHVEATIDILTIICNKVWKTGDWPTMDSDHCGQER